MRTSFTKMTPVAFRGVLICLLGLAFTTPTFGQASDAIHEIVVFLRARGAQVSGVRIRLLRESRMLPIGETFSSDNGQIKFSGLLPGKYIVETFETEKFEPTTTVASITTAEFSKPRALHVTVTVDLPPRAHPENPAPGVVMADVDLNVPESARKHFRKGEESLQAGKNDEAAKEFKAAIAEYPEYYAARLELGRQLRTLKRFSDAEEVLRPLAKIAPKRAEPQVEYGMVLLALDRKGASAAALRLALSMEEANWATHLYLGWALIGAEPQQAASHFARALELDERKAAQAHLSLARLAHANRQRQEAIGHLEAYLRLEPNASDAVAVRKLLEQLRN